MAFSWQVLEDQRLGYGRLHGVVSGQDLLAASDAFFNDPAWQVGYDLLWDNRRIKKLAIQPADVPEILRRAVQVRQYLGSGRAAAVIQQDLRIMAEHLIQMSGLDEMKVRLFTVVEQAYEWLDVAVEEVETAS